jgi:hypothetical protein
LLFASCFLLPTSYFRLTGLLVRMLKNNWYVRGTG